MKNTTPIKTTKHTKLFIDKLLNEVVIKEILNAKALVEVNTDYIKVIQ